MRNPFAALILLAGASLGMSVHNARPERFSGFADPPRRKRNPVMQTDYMPDPAKHEPEVLSKRAQRRVRGKAKGARRGHEDR